MTAPARRLWEAVERSTPPSTSTPEDGGLTDEGAALRSVVEEVTDTAAEPGRWALGGATPRRARSMGWPPSPPPPGPRAPIPFPNAMGLPGGGPA